MKSLRDLRLEAGLTLQGVAERIGCSLNAVSRWETGKSRPVPRMIPRLAELYGVTPEQVRLHLSAGPGRRPADAAEPAGVGA